jgi:hypothetical protein
VKRFLATTVLALLAIGGLAACSSGDDAAVEVNGETVLTVDELQDQLDELADSPDALTALDGRGTGGDATLSSGFVSSVLDNHVLLAVIRDQVASEGIEVDDADVEAGTQILSSQLGSSDSGAPLELEAVPASYRQTLIDLFANYAALIVEHGGNIDDPSDPANQAALQDISDQLLQLREDADVQIASRYGRWDTETDRPSVAPPDGPATPTTEPLAVPAGG